MSDFLTDIYISLLHIVLSAKLIIRLLDPRSLQGILIVDKISVLTFSHKARLLRIALLVLMLIVILSLLRWIAIILLITSIKLSSRPSWVLIILSGLLLILRVVGK